MRAKYSTYDREHWQSQAKDPAFLENYMQLGEVYQELIFYPTYMNIMILDSLNHFSQDYIRTEQPWSTSHHLGRLVQYGIIERRVFEVRTANPKLNSYSSKSFTSSELTLEGKSCLLALRAGYVWRSKRGMLKEDTNRFFTLNVCDGQPFHISEVNYANKILTRRGGSYELQELDLMQLAGSAKITEFPCHEELRERAVLWRLQRD